MWESIIPATPSTVVSGRVDYSIGLVLDTRAKDTSRRRFYSPLLLVEAKFDLCVDFALAQLVVYLGSLRHMKRCLKHILGAQNRRRREMATNLINMDINKYMASLYLFRQASCAIL